jgi:transposase
LHLDAIRHKYIDYSPELKLTAINRVLSDGEYVNSVAIDIGLPTDSLLRQWIKSYIENGYNVVTKKKGRPSTRGKEKEDSRRAGEGERATEKGS